MKILDFFRKIFNKELKQILLKSPKTRYQQLVESIDDLELCKLFLGSITPELIKQYQRYGAKAYEFPLQTRISKEHTIEIVQKFFEEIDDEMLRKVNDIINGNNPNIKLQMKENDNSGASVSQPDKFPIVVNVPIRNDIRQLYEFIHELTHTLDIENGDTETRRVLGEISPQCMERLLDDYLLGMSDEEMQKYGFDRKVIEKDIKTRRLMTFLTRYHNAISLDRRNGNRELDSRYMLAQIYSAHFNKFDKKEKCNKLISFIKCVQDDDFEKANETFGMQIGKENKLQREFYISDTISEVDTLVKPQNVENTKYKENTQEKEQDIIK